MKPLVSSQSSAPRPLHVAESPCADALAHSECGADPASLTTDDGSHQSGTPVGREARYFVFGRRLLTAKYSMS